MKKRIKRNNRYSAIAVSLSCIASFFSTVPQLASAESVSDEVIQSDVCNEEVVKIVANETPDDELLYNYMLIQSGVKPQPDSTKNGIPVTYESGVTAGSKLTGMDKNVYDYLKTEIQAIAAGQRTSTEIEIPFSILRVKDGPWSASELGVSYIYSNGQYSQEALNAAQAKSQYDYRKVVLALLADFPYDFYWCDKTSYRPSSRYSYSARWEDGEFKLYLTQNHTLTLYVSTDYSENGVEKTTILPDGRLTAVQNAISNAQGLVDLFNDRSGKELLALYREAICMFTTYDDDAIAYDADYGDPWQLINVFDGDPDTKVVCEGYAKAFKYLCDLSADRLPNISCLIATGTTTGPHMWNVVNMEDNRSYLVDVTLCDAMDDYVDEGALTPQAYVDAFFLAVPSGGTYNTTYQFSRPEFTFNYGGYTYSMAAGTYYYTYDQDTLETYDNKYLKLSSIPYVAYTYVPAVAATCETDGNIAYYLDSAGKYYIIDNSGAYIETDADSVVVPKTGHDWNPPSYTWNGYNSVTAKRVCKNDASHVETETANVSSRVSKAATCTEKGKTTYTAQFSNPAFANQTKTVEDINALGHSYGAPVYIWSADGSSCTATVRCTRPGCNDVITESAVITAEVLTPADYITKGWTRYTASFSDSHFSSQIKDVQDIPVLVGTDVVIEVIDINGFITRTTVYAEVFTGFDLPAGNYIDGYTFKGWTVNGTLYTVKSDAQFAIASAVSEKPVVPIKVALSYEKINALYNVSVTGGKLSNGKTKGKAIVSQLVTVKADTVDGKQFSHWMRNGVKVSTNSTYSFRMPEENVNLTAVYVNVAIEATGTAFIESVKVNGTKISFVSVLNVPENATFIKGGLVATSNGNIGQSVTASNASYVKLSTKATAKTKNLKYTWTKSAVTSNTIWYVRGYLVYKDSSGVEHIVYSDCVKANINGIVD